MNANVAPRSSALLRANRFTTDGDCLEHLFRLRFQAPQCPQCLRTGQRYFHRHAAKRCYTCNCGQHHIYPMQGTIFQGSPVSLAKWYRAVFLRCQGATGKDLQRQLKVSYATAWRMMHRIDRVISADDRFEPAGMEQWIGLCCQRVS